MVLLMEFLMVYEISAKLLQATLVKNELLGIGGVWAYIYGGYHEQCTIYYR